MSLINRIKKARAKADKLSAKSKKAESKGKEGKAARLEKRSEKKSGKADKLDSKLVKKDVKPSSFMTGAAFSAKAAFAKDAEMMNNFKKSASSIALQQEIQRLQDRERSNANKPKPADTRKYGLKDTSRKTSYKPKPRNK